MTNIHKLLNEVLRDIKPDEEYEKKIFNILNSILKRLNSELENAKAVLGGSGAKGTWLRSFDADIFVLFSYNKYKNKSDRLSDILGPVLKRCFRNVKRLHGSRDYFQIHNKDFTFEIVPLLKLNNARQAKNITDVSPLHSKWVLKHKKLSDQTRLTKQFCRAQRVYGAESYIRGFSGYICEIITIFYGSFLNLARNAVKWKPGTVIDVECHYKKKDVFRELNKSKLTSPLVVIDPVQKDRNAAAALSNEKFNDFKMACKKFLQNPSKKFFIEEPITIGSILKKKKNNKIILLIVTPLKGKEDVVGVKILKVFNFVREKSAKYGFKLLESDWQWSRNGKALLYYIYDKSPLPKEHTLRGPPVSIKNHAESFKKKHKKIFVKDSYIWAVNKREYIHPEDYVKLLIKDEFIINKAKHIQIIRKK